VIHNSFLVPGGKFQVNSTQISDTDVSVTRLIAERWPIMLIVSIAFIVVAGVLTSFMPKKYESSMKFLVSDERADLVLTPERSQQEPPQPVLTEAEVNSEIELMNSEDILLDVVLKNKLYLPSKDGDDASGSPRGVQRAIAKLKKNLTISVIHRANIIEVQYKANSPENARTVLQTLGDDYLAAHLKAHSAPGSSEFYAGKVNEYSTALQDARDKLATFHNETHLFSLPQQQTAAIDGLQSTDVQLKDVGVKMAELQGRLSADQTQISNTPGRMTTQERSLPYQQATEQLESMLANMRNRRIAMATKFKPSDRLIKELDQQIAGTEAQLAKLRGDPASEQTTDVNPIREAAESEMSTSQIELRALKARSEALSDVRAQYLQQLSMLDENSLTLEKLLQAEKDAQDNYDIYTKNLNEARLAGSMDQQKFSNVHMVETPYSSPLPVSPKLSVNLAAGAVLGFIVSFGFAFYQEAKQKHEVVQMASISAY